MQELNPTTYSLHNNHLEVVVGDEKQTDFYPRVKLKAWNNEANFSVGLKGTKGKHRKKGDKVVYTDGPVTADFYQTTVKDLPTIDDKHCDGFEFSITLSEKPQSNVIPLTIRTKGLTFHYQPPLTKEEAKTATRPDNVQGSYAVYHESKMNNEYTTGKAFHIYRPWAQDANGNRVWCELHIDTDKKGRALKEEISITIPLDFLEAATYPVLIDPTFGYAAVGASSASAGNTIRALANVRGGTGTGSAIFAYGTPASTGSSLYFQWAMYTAAGTNVMNSIEAGPYTSTQSTTWWGGFAVAQIGEANYDLAVWSNAPAVGTQFSVNYDTLTNAGKNQSATYASYTWPSMAAATTDNNRYSIYFLYTAGAIGRLIHQTVTGTSASTTCVATYTTTTTAGNLLVAAVWNNVNNTTASISGWTVAKAQSATGAGTITILCKVADGTETTVTASATSASLMRITINEYAGPIKTVTGGNPDAIGQTDGATTASAATASCGSITTTYPNTMLFAAIGWVGGNTSAPSFDNSFGTVSTDTRMAVGERIVTATGTYTTAASWTTSRASASAIVAFEHMAIKAHSALGVG